MVVVIHTHNSLHYNHRMFFSNHEILYMSCYQSNFILESLISSSARLVGVCRNTVLSDTWSMGIGAASAFSLSVETLALNSSSVCTSIYHISFDFISKI